MRKKRAAAERYVRLTYGMMQSRAWRSLDGNARAIYVELAMLYCGVGTNNGRIGFSARQAARAIQVSTATAARAMIQLQDQAPGNTLAAHRVQLRRHRPVSQSGLRKL